jgi:hypothetical protein
MSNMKPEELYRRRCLRSYTFHVDDRISTTGPALLEVMRRAGLTKEQVEIEDAAVDAWLRSPKR